MLDQLTGPANLLKAVAEAMQRAEGEQPEAWARPIEQAFVATGKAAREDAAADVERLVRNWQAGARVAAQREDLRALVRQHYLCRLADDQKSVFWAVPHAVQQSWRERGLLGPVTEGRNLRNTMEHMAEASRLADALDRNTTFANMRASVRDTQPDDTEKLALLIANDTLTLAIERLSSRHGDNLADIASLAYRRHLLGLLGGVAHGVRGSAKNVRERLARDMADMLGGKDVGREWERAAVTTTRYAYNVGVLSALRTRGTEWVAYDVHPQACAHCKALLLLHNGTPRAFSLGGLWQQIADDGGLNVGRKASLTGREGGWRVGVVIHPWCRCRPRRAKQVEIRQTQKERTNA
jgi:hypothetical protein